MCWKCTQTQTHRTLISTHDRREPASSPCWNRAALSSPFPIKTQLHVWILTIHQAWPENRERELWLWAWRKETKNITQKCFFGCCVMLGSKKGWGVLDVNYPVRKFDTEHSNETSVCCIHLALYLWHLDLYIFLYDKLFYIFEWIVHKSKLPLG